MFGKLGERMVNLFVPSISADAGTAAPCTYPNCGPCRNGVQRYKKCCRGKCSTCQYATTC